MEPRGPEKRGAYMQLQDRGGRKGKTSGVREGDVRKGSKLRQREKPRFQGRRERDREVNNAGSVG